MASSSSSSSSSISLSSSSSSAAAAVSASAPSAMSQPLDNFAFPLWNRSGINKRSRSIKSPPQRSNAASATPFRHSPLEDSSAAPPPRPRHQQPRFQTSIRDRSMSPRHLESWRRESSLPPPPPPQHFRQAGRDCAMPPHRFESWRRESSPPIPPPPRFSMRTAPRFQSWRRESSPPLPPPPRFSAAPRFESSWRRTSPPTSPSRFSSWRRESSPSTYRFQPWRREAPRHDFSPPPSRSRSQYRDFPEPRSRFPEFPSPPRRFQPLIREPAAEQPPRFQNRDMFRDNRSAATPQAQPQFRANPPREPSAIDDEEFERLAFLREESLRNYRGRDWWSESSEDRRSPVIAYSRNPNKKTGFSAPLVHPTMIGASSSNSADAPKIPDTSEFPETKIQTSSRVDEENPNVPVLTNEAAPSSSSSQKLPQVCSDESKAPAADSTDAAGVKKPGYKIKIPIKKGKEEESPPKKKDEEEPAPVKTWNLRPRNTLRRKPQTTAPLLRSSAPKPAAEKKEKKKLSVQVSLTAEEIEEDIFSLTGEKPSRRPKKHPKAVQKQLDVLFPGLSLLSITSETYN